MEEKREIIHIETVGEKMAQGWLKFKKGFINYSKVNYLAYVCGALMLLFLILQILPAASINVTHYLYNAIVDGEVIEASFDGSVIFSYSFWDVIFGRIEQLPVTVNGVVSSAPYFCYFVKFNVLLGVGILLLVAGAVCAFVNHRTPRVVGAILAVIGFVLVALFTYNQVGYNLPILVNNAETTYSLTWLIGPVIEIIVALLVTALTIVICVFDIRRRSAHKKSESARYMRGGI